jgi:hypothetical protein
MENFNLLLLHTIIWKRKLRRKTWNMMVHQINIKKLEFEICCPSPVKLVPSVVSLCSRQTSYIAWWPLTKRINCPTFISWLKIAVTPDQWRPIDENETMSLGWPVPRGINTCLGNTRGPRRDSSLRNPARHHYNVRNFSDRRWRMREG